MFEKFGRFDESVVKPAGWNFDEVWRAGRELGIIGIRNIMKLEKSDQDNQCSHFKCKSITKTQR